MAASSEDRYAALVEAFRIDMEFPNYAANVRGDCIDLGNNSPEGNYTPYQGIIGVHDQLRASFILNHPAFLDFKYSQALAGPRPDTLGISQGMLLNAREPQRLWLQTSSLS